MDNGCKQATQEELCYGALNHYKELSMKAMDWHSQIERAIKFWYLEKPKLEQRLEELEPRKCCGNYASCTEDACVPRLHYLLEQANKER